MYRQRERIITLFEIYEHGQAMLNKQVTENFLLSTVRKVIDTHEGQNLNSQLEVFQRAHHKETVHLEDVYGMV
jgi:hypothetical protein